ncbi:MAG: bacitracin ABC transporter ATP-binding protein [Bacteroidetes bacterium]|nr:MAG: bacitracin ABC transporter ATP-binding protein [Bacteroidota bacterium]
MIKVENLNFSYQKGVQIINNLSFEVPQGSIYGFLGGNGAGKTTTIRIILGLCKADSGKVFINGKPFSGKSYQQYRKIGAMIEEPSLYPHISGNENLRLLANYYKVNQKRINEVLELVGLSDAKHKKAGNYSLGMKQRLGIAQSLLHNPEILILDEPINGLDPRGIKEIRELLFRLRDEGKTIFISSHILGEVEKSCDNLCIIDNGTKVFSDKTTNLQTLLFKEIQYQINCNDSKKVQEFFLKNKVKTELVDDTNIIISLPNDKIIAEYLKQIMAENVSLFEVRKKKNSLEDMFIKLTQTNN